MIAPPVVVGAGPAGLAVAAELHRRGLACTVLERGESVGGVLAGPLRQPAPAHGSRAVGPARRTRPQTVRALGRPRRRRRLPARVRRPVRGAPGVRGRRPPDRPHRRFLDAPDVVRQPGGAPVVLATGYSRVPVPAGVAGEGHLRRCAACTRRSTGSPRRTAGGTCSSWAPATRPPRSRSTSPARGHGSTCRSGRRPTSSGGARWGSQPALRDRAETCARARHEPGVREPCAASRCPTSRRTGCPHRPGDGFTQFLRTRTVPILDHGFVAAVRAGRIRVVADVARIGGPEVHLSTGESSGRRRDLCHRLPDRAGADGRPPGCARRAGRAARARRADAAGLPGLFVVGVSVELAGLLREIGREARAVARALANPAQIEDGT